jgi:hypothetical protein
MEATEHVRQPIKEVKQMMLRRLQLKQPQQLQHIVMEIITTYYRKAQYQLVHTRDYRIFAV